MTSLHLYNFLKNIFPKKNFSYKTQSVNFNNYKKAVKNLLSKGYKVVRVGLYHEKTIDIEHKNYLDLFNSGKRTDLLEIFLISKCMFQIGSFSGGSTTCEFFFRKPIANILTWESSSIIYFPN